MAQILIVDDEAGIRFYLEEALTRDGHSVVTVANGQAALKEIAARSYDLALIDLKLSDMDGLSLLAALRSQSPDTVTIVLTAYASLETAVEALRGGAHDYLFKPCKTVELRESVRSGLLKRQRELLVQNLLADSSPEQGRFRQWGGLIVDFMRHVITLDGKLLELSPTEFDLLAYLVSAAPRVVPPQELAREVQQYNREAWEASDTLRYHFYRLRRRIKEASGHTDIIRTVRGVGYTIGE